MHTTRVRLSGVLLVSVVAVAGLATLLDAPEAPAAERGGEGCVIIVCETSSTSSTTTAPPTTTTSVPSTSAPTTAAPTTTAPAETTTSSTRPAQTTTLFTIARPEGGGEPTSTTLEFVPGAAYTTATWPVVLFVLAILGTAAVLAAGWYRTRGER